MTRRQEISIVPDRYLDKEQEMRVSLGYLNVLIHEGVAVGLARAVSRRCDPVFDSNWRSFVLLAGILSLEPPTKAIAFLLEKQSPTLWKMSRALRKWSSPAQEG